MNKRPEADKPDLDNPEWTEEDFVRAVPFDRQRLTMYRNCYADIRG